MHSSGNHKIFFMQEKEQNNNKNRIKKNIALWSAKGRVQIFFLHMHHLTSLENLSA